MQSLSIFLRENPRFILRFWDRVAKDSMCWPYMGLHDADGYGRLTMKHFGNGYALAHRIAYTLAYGDIPPNLYVLHHCDNPPCVHPTHLFLGTNGDNLKDAILKGRRQPGVCTRFGEANSQSKLTANAVSAIRSTGNLSYARLAQQWGISDSQIGRILRRENWRQLT